LQAAAALARYLSFLGEVQSKEVQEVIQKCMELLAQCAVFSQSYSKEKKGKLERTTLSALLNNVGFYFLITADFDTKIEKFKSDITAAYNEMKDVVDAKTFKNTEETKDLVIDIKKSNGEIIELISDFVQEVRDMKRPSSIAVIYNDTPEWIQDVTNARELITEVQQFIFICKSLRLMRSATAN
jgi:hypothetical protein